MYFTTIFFILLLNISRASSLLHAGGNSDALTELRQNLSQLQSQMWFLQNNVFELNKTNIEQQKTIAILEKKLNGSGHQQQQNTLNLQGYINRSISTYDVILHDVVATANNINNSVSSLQAQLHDVVFSTNSISKNMQLLQKQVQYESLAMANTVRQMLAMNNSLQDVVRNVYTMNSSVIAKSNNIAFTVSIATYGPVASQKIIYNRVITNIGNAYSTQTGVFTCPSDGEYLFTWSVLSGDTSQRCVVYIYKNGVQLLCSYSHEDGESRNEASSNTIILSLVAGDEVWTQSSPCGYYNGYPYTAFSGMKL